MNLIFSIFFSFLPQQLLCLLVPPKECELHTCVSIPESCFIKANCYAIVLIKENRTGTGDFDREWIFNLYLDRSRTEFHSQWVAAALSVDEVMGDDVAVHCLLIQHGVKALFEHGYTQKKGVYKTIEDGFVLGVKKGTVEVDKLTVMRCEWTRNRYSNLYYFDRDKVVDSKPLKPIDLLGAQYFVLLAAGFYDPMEDHLLQHLKEHRVVSKDRIGGTMYDGCEVGPIFDHKLCFGWHPRRELNECVAKRDCHIVVMIKQLNGSYYYQTRVIDKKVLHDRDTRVETVSVGLSADEYMEDIFTTDCIIDEIDKLKMTNRHNNKIIATVATSINISMHKLKHSFPSVMECIWLLPEAPLPPTIDTARLLYLFIRLANHEKKTHLTKFPIMFPTFRGELHPNNCSSEKNPTNFQCFVFRNFSGNEADNEKCIENKNCLVHFTVKTFDTFYLFTLVGNTGHGTWVAAGLSKDDKMGDDFVFECISNEEKAVGRISWNSGHTNRDARVNIGIDIDNVSVRRNIIVCTFRVKSKFSIFVDETLRKVDSTDETHFHIIAAYGKTRRDETLIIKLKHDFKMSSSKRLRLLAKDNSSAISTDIVTTVIIVFLILGVIVVVIVLSILYVRYQRTISETVNEKSSSKSSEKSKRQSTKISQKQKSKVSRQTKRKISGASLALR